ncbi:hypothetical protein DQQ10_15990 [Pseudochryseolinea flava]|uniref:ABC transporter ATP-binding protein n=2 Tax=Pseudochryseolinea flava TaxID=2059302 RepID=A0A364Y1A2_9BACT|nr:hypothetical protein DQQ10_15990 [Pseudochryseolinea flava]
MEQLKEFLLKYKRQSVAGVIFISILLGMGLMKKVTQLLPYYIKQNKWDASLPVWFDPYGVAGVGFLIALIMIFLINWTFKILMRDLEKGE